MVDWAKLSKLFGMMGSNQAGEALNARDLVEAMLQKEGLSWTDLSRRVGSPATEARPQAAPGPNWANGDFSPPPWAASADRDFRTAAGTIFELQQRIEHLQADIAASRDRYADVFRGLTGQVNELKGQLVVRESLLQNALGEARWLREQVEQAQAEAEFLRAKLPQLSSASASTPMPGPSAYDAPIAEIPGLTQRIKRALRISENITMLSQAAALTRDKILRIPNLGRKSYSELRAVLIAHGWWDETTPSR